MKIFSRLFDNNGSLSQKAARGGVWVFALRIVEVCFNLCKLIILARILAPSDFGLLGIALLTIATLETFSQTGFQQALIQKKGDTHTYLNSAWTVLILRSMLLFIVLFFVAPYAADFFNTSEAKLIIRVIGFSIILQAFTNIGIVYFQKELKFNKQFLYRFSGTVADFVVAVSLALILRNIWALVFGFLAGDFARFIMSYIVHPYRPRISLDLKKAKELFSFGKWIFASSILVFLITQGDDVFVGKLLGVAALGFYQMAYRISNMPATQITHVISQVAFPAYSKLQDDVSRLKGAYLQISQLTAFLSIPIAGLIFILALDFTKIFLGEKWMPIVPVIRVLVLWGVIRALVGAMSPVFISMKKPHIVTKMQFFQVILLFILIFPLTISLDILGTSLAVLFSALIMFLIRNHILIKTIQCKFWNFYKPIVFPTVLTIIGILSVSFLKIFFVGASSICFFITIVVFTFVFCLLTYLADRVFDYGILTILRKHFI